MKEINQKAVDNFIATIDRSLDYKDHILNAIHDAIDYSWTMETVKEIEKQLKKIYENKGI